MRIVYPVTGFRAHGAPVVCVQLLADDDVRGLRDHDDRSDAVHVLADGDTDRAAGGHAGPKRPVSAHQGARGQSLDDPRETAAALDPPATGQRRGRVSVRRAVDRVPGRRVREQGPREVHHAGVHGRHGAGRGPGSRRVQPVRQLVCGRGPPVSPRVTKRARE